MLVGNGASIVRGESFEADADTVEEVVTGSVPVSDGARVVEQAVQGQASANDEQSWSTGQYETGVR